MNNQVIKVRNVQTINNSVEQTGRSPYIGENGNWFEFNDETQSFVDSGVKAEGIQGIQGIQGEDGYTPIKGVDYFTESDIGEIVDIVTEKAIGDIDTILSTLTTVEEVSE